jgi:hypothetical protein
MPRAESGNAEVEEVCPAGSTARHPEATGVKEMREMATTERPTDQTVTGTAEAVDRRRRARYVVFAVTATFLALASAFTVGGASADPGGTTAVVLTLVWVLPAAALGAFTVLRPARAEQVLIVATALVALFIVVQALTDVIPSDDVGPVGTIAALAISIPLALLGLHRAGMAGRLLVGLGLVLGISGLLGAPAGSATALALPLLVFGVLFLLVAEPSGGRRRATPPATT